MNISSLEKNIPEIRNGWIRISCINAGSYSIIPAGNCTEDRGCCRSAGIILFGSYAYGTPNKDSDIDILVIMETDRPRHKRSVAINRALAGLLIPKDVLVYTPAEVDDGKDVPQAFVTQVLKKGVVVYDKDKKRFDPGLV
jgi:predicted nucleotidyltransferase